MPVINFIVRKLLHVLIALPLLVVACIFETSPNPFTGNIQKISKIGQDSTMSYYRIAFSGQNWLDTLCIDAQLMSCPNNWYQQNPCFIELDWFPDKRKTCGGHSKSYTKRDVLDTIIKDVPKEWSNLSFRLKVSDNELSNIHFTDWIKVKE